MKTFPIYLVDFVLYNKDVELCGCTQEVMLLAPYSSHDEALRSLKRLSNNLAVAVMGIDAGAWTMAGSITYRRHDSWCLHWKSHYTYQRFPTNEKAISAFMTWLEKEDRWGEVGDPETLVVCPCKNCKALNRTMIIHSGESKCDCSSVS